MSYEYFLLPQLIKVAPAYNIGCEQLLVKVEGDRIYCYNFFKDMFLELPSEMIKQTEDYKKLDTDEVDKLILVSKLIR